MPSDSIRDHRYAFLGAGIIAGVFIERLFKSAAPLESAHEKVLGIRKKLAQAG
jgi:hypothetical protein